MRTQVIKVSELEQFLKLVKLEQELKVRLQIFNKQQRLQLESLKKIKTIAGHLHAFKGVKWKFDKEIMKEIDKYGKW